MSISSYNDYKMTNIYKSLRGNSHISYEFAKLFYERNTSPDYANFKKRQKRISDRIAYRIIKQMYGPNINKNRKLIAQYNNKDLDDRSYQRKQKDLYYKLIDEYECYCDVIYDD